MTKKEREKMVSQQGLIGFFDILGYQNLLENNEAEEIADTVIPILTSIENNVKERLLEYYHQICIQNSGKILKAIGENEDGEWSVKHSEVVSDLFLRNLDWLVFSDTIVLSTKITSFEECAESIIGFFLSCQYLMKSMFSMGFPLRGAIDYGSFIVQDKCFAGKSIVSAYKLSNNLELAACVVSDSCRKKFEECEGKEVFNFYKSLVCDYLLPTKDGEVKSPTLIYFPDIHSRDDLRATVLNAFWAYNKTIPLFVKNKVDNTEQWFRFVEFSKSIKK